MYNGTVPLMSAELMNIKPSSNIKVSVFWNFIFSI